MPVTLTSCKISRLENCLRLTRSSCNWLGNQAWTNALEYAEHDKFAKAPVKKWKMSSAVGDVSKGTHVGETKNYGNFTFLRVFEAGHVRAPFSRPLQYFRLTLTRWSHMINQSQLCPFSMTGSEERGLSHKH